MSDFFFTEHVPEDRVISACLGPNSSTKFADADIGKAVKLGTAQNYVLAVEGDDIDGFVTSIEPATYNNGFSFGGVKLSGWKYAEVGANQVGQMAVGDFVVADAQVALGTAGAPKVKTGVAFSQSGTTPFAVTQATPLRRFWQCMRIVSGNGSAGDKVLVALLS